MDPWGYSWPHQPLRNAASAKSRIRFQSELPSSIVGPSGNAVLAWTKHKDDKTDDVAQVLMMKAMLYTQVLQDEGKGK